MPAIRKMIPPPDMSANGFVMAVKECLAWTVDHVRLVAPERNFRAHVLIPPNPPIPAVGPIPAL